MNLFSCFFNRGKILSVEFLKKKDIPSHVAIIMDGNGRWARKRGLPRIAGHREGVDSLRRIIKACIDLNIKVLTVYVFSSENWKRPKKEVSNLMNLFFETISREIDELISNRVKVNLIGQKDLIPEKVLKRFEDAEAKTHDFNSLILNIAFSYGARQEIAQAVKKVAQDCKNGHIDIEDIHEELLSNYLFTKDCPDPDLLIRTSGEFRISNFLLWQIAYTELYFDKTLWPDFKEKQFFIALDSYQRRTRRFGKI